MAVFRPNANYFMDYEDTGSFGEPTIDEVIAQLVAPTQPVAPTTVSSQPVTFDDLAKLYNEQGATTTSSYETEQGTQYNTTTNELADGWMAWEKPPEVVYTEGSGESATNYYGPSELGGFSRKDGDYVNFYDLSGNLVDRQKWNQSALTSAWNDLGPVVMAALTAGGAGGALGNAILGEGASQVAANALGGALLGGGGAAIGGGDVLKSALLGGAGGALSGYMASDVGGTNVNAPVGNAELNAASDLATNMAEAGLSTGEIAQQLESVGYLPEAVSFALEDAQNVIAAANPVTQETPQIATEVIQPTLPEAPIEIVQVSAPAQPVQVPQAPVLSDVINAIVAQQTSAPLAEMVTTSDRPKTTQEVIDTIAPPIVIPTETIPEVVTTGERPRPITEEQPSTIVDSNLPIPVITPSAPIDTTIPQQEKKYTLSELADMARLGLLGAGFIAGTTADSGPTGFDIVPVPEEWKSPVYQKDISPYPALTPIDFGTRNLLKGTQWEKFLDPNYGKVPAPVQFNQPSNMSYDRLIGILGTGRDTLPSQTLTINDVISGIQNQYGQKP
jgi:hypothetical protein